jgi:undecaprenyl diphosphate synthase
MKALRSTIAKESGIPVHVGIIMDGNGRWAVARNKPRTFGHEEGLKAAKRIVRAASEIGIRYITLYTFSTENWKRAKAEVSFLMGLIKKHLRKELDFYREHSIRVIYSGDIAGLPKGVVSELVAAERETSHFTGVTANLAINYGGRDEIVRAVNRLFTDKSESGNPKTITQQDIEARFDHPELPDIDLVVRTGGEKRLSNFYIWESAYAELCFSPKLWPDWEKADLIAAVKEFQKRERRFGNAK